MARILVVDDESNILTLVRIMLENKGYKVTEALNGEKCLEILEKKAFDLILLDVKMPGEDGWEICKKIKRAEETKDIPVAMFTVRVSKEDVKKSRECGADTHINKPFDMEELLDTVKRLLEKTAFP